MEFLHIYDCTATLRELEEGKEIFGAENTVKYFVQPDTFDFHAYRVNKDGGAYRVDETLIGKADVLAKMNIAFNGRKSMSDELKKLTSAKIARTAILLDGEKGWEIDHSQKADSLETAISLITDEDFYSAEAL